MRVFNVENLNATASMPADARAVNQKKFQNVGPTITYKLRDKAGQAREYISYMQPLPREGALFFATGERSDMNEPFRWLMLPADPRGKLDSFMAFRAVLLQPAKRQQIVEKAIANVGEHIRPQFKLAVENLLQQFAEGGYIAINEHIQKNVPPADQQKTGEFMYQILYSTMNIALDEALQDAGLPNIEAGETRNRFILNSLDGYTGLTGFQSPVLLQLEDFKQVNMSGLQMTKSPGATLVYLGSLFLVLGVMFMFYVRDKRAWMLFPSGHAAVRFAMSSSRSERDLNREFPKYVADFTRLAQDFAAADNAHHSDS